MYIYTLKAVLVVIVVTVFDFLKFWFAGGFPDTPNIADKTSGHFRDPFVGSLKDLRISENGQVVDFMKVDSGANVLDYNDQELQT